MNEAAILAARRDLKEISKHEISDAPEGIIAGPEKENDVVSEAGHALVGALMLNMTQQPRCPSSAKPEVSLFCSKLRETRVWAIQVAEEVRFGAESVTIAASNDFMQVSRVARQMIESVLAILSYLAVSSLGLNN
ncbi:hypothetical protein NL676_030799 [Syzygium grande]|nr:hypothetical protein NL676_030799 [Syzygium grande]